MPTGECGGGAALRGSGELQGVGACRVWRTRSLARVYHWSIPGVWVQYTAGVYQVAGSSIPLGASEVLGSWPRAGVGLAGCGDPGHLLEYTAGIYLVAGSSIP